MQGQHENRPLATDAEPGHVRGAQQVEAEVVRVEQRLREQTFFDDAEGQREDQDRRPATAAAARELADQHRGGAVQRHEHREHAELLSELGQAGEVLITEEELGDERREQGECGDRGLAKGHEVIVSLCEHSHTSRKSRLSP
ncbi:hypothetical protein AB0878_15250 [Amycolatopsis sp. NPDC047767]|uniref:hypothetical protein n=1 Tax=Amycolatopsis sp. NPDC047767 TaxID=3156765 RepID=UPI003451EF59